MVLTNQPYVYEIRIEGLLTEHWSDWFGGLAVQNHADGETTLRGVFPDQAALFGVLTRIHGLNLMIISVNRLAPQKTQK